MNVKEAEKIDYGRKGKDAIFNGVVTAILISMLYILFSNFGQIEQAKYKKSVGGAYIELTEAELDSASKAAARLLDYYNNRKALQNIKNSSIDKETREQFVKVHNYLEIIASNLSTKEEKDKAIKQILATLFIREDATKESDIKLRLLPVGAIVINGAYTIDEKILYDATLVSLWSAFFFNIGIILYGCYLLGRA